MQRVTLSERPDWKSKAEELGFHFHTMYGEPYWDETSAYAFTLDQIETDIEDPSNALHAMCLDAVDAIVGSEELMSRLGIPQRLPRLRRRELGAPRAGALRPARPRL